MAAPGCLVRCALAKRRDDAPALKNYLSPPPPGPPGGPWGRRHFSLLKETAGPWKQGVLGELYHPLGYKMNPKAIVKCAVYKGSNFYLMTFFSLLSGDEKYSCITPAWKWWPFYFTHISFFTKPKGVIEPLPPPAYAPARNHQLHTIVLFNLLYPYEFCFV